MKLWHRDPRFAPRLPRTPEQQEHRAAVGELIFTAAVALIGLLGLYVSAGG